MADLNFDVNWRDGGMSRGLDELARKVDNLSNQVNRLDKAEANPNIKLEIKEAEAKVKEFQDDLKKLQGTKVQINADTARARAELNNVQNQLKELKAQSANVEVDADVAAAEAKIEELKAKLADLKTQRLDFDANTAGVTAKIDEMKAKLATIRDVHINVDADTAGATAQITAFSAFTRAATDNSSLFSEALRAIVGAAGAAASAIGSVITSGSNMLSALSGSVGVFQSLAQGGIQAGGALTQFGTSLTDVASKSGDFASAAASVIQSLIQMAVQMALVTSAVAAIGGAVSLAVAGISQLGGAAIALVSGIGPLVGSLGLLPGLLAPLGVGLGALVIGFSNAGKGGIEFKNTMDQLKSAFAPVVDSIRSQMQPAIQNFLDSIKSLAPVIQSVVPQITSAVSQVTNSFANMFKSSSFQSDLQTLLSGAAQNIKVFGDAAKSAFQGFMNIMVAAQPAVDRIAQDIANAAQKFNEWTAAARQSGELTAMFQQTATVLEQLGNTLTNIAGLFKDLWDSANRTGAFTSVLDSINGLISRWRDNIQQVGGTWDQLMQRVQQVAPQIMGLIGDIGQAFAEIGANVDLGPAIEGIRAMIPGIKQAFTDMANAASEALKTIGPDISDLAATWGPQISTTITNIAQLFHQWEPAIKAAGTAIITTANAIIIGLKGIGTAADAASTAVSAGWKMLHGDVTGAAADWGQFEERQRTVWSAVQTGTQEAGSAVQGFGQTGSQAFTTVLQASEGLGNALIAANQSIQQYGTSSDLASTAGQHNAQAMTGVVTAANTLMTALANSGASAEDMNNKHQQSVEVIQRLGQQMGLTDQQIQAFVAQLNAVPPAKDVKINADTSIAMSAIQATTSAITGIPLPDPILLSGDPSGAVTAAGTATTSTQGVPDKNVKITGDPAPVQGAVGQANSSLGGLQDKTVKITGDNSAMITALDEITTKMNTIGDKLVKITADNTDAITKAQATTDALNAIADKNVNITANNQQALQAIQQVQTALDNLHDKTVTVTTNYVTTGTPPGQAAGSILEPMGRGGITYGRDFGNLLPMAPGGMVGRRMTPMSASIPRIVQPNTWRVIGDRASGAEAFIPINRSPRSRALLHETARRMGEVAIPKEVIHFHRGGYWDWFRHHRPMQPPPLPQQLMQTLGRPNVSSFGVGSSVGLSGSALPISPAMLNTFYNPGTRSIPNAGPAGSVPSGGSPPIHVTGDGALFQAFLRMLRGEVRKRGARAVLAID